MQLKARLSLAACTLLGLPTTVPAAETPGWQLETAVLSYREQDRVEATEPVLALQHDWDDGRRLALRYSYDSLSGASPTGAQPSLGSGGVQTVTSASGRLSTQPLSQSLVMDPGFQDERHAYGLGWRQPLGDQSRLDLGLDLARERDFRSEGATLQAATDLLQKNLTLLAGLTAETSTVSAVGGNPSAFALIGGSAPRHAAARRDVQELLLSATALTGPDAWLQLGVFSNRASGYLNDPYKVLSVLDPQTGQPIEAREFDSSLPQGLPASLFERRPERHERQGVTVGYRQHLGHSIVDLTYRGIDDDWQADSRTVEVKWRWLLSERFYLEPQGRWSEQEAAYFYRHSLINFQDLSGGQPRLRYASADPRLNAFTATTLGLKLGWQDRNQAVSLRLARYTQRGDSHPADAIGAERALDLFPDLKATLVQFSWQTRL